MLALGLAFIAAGVLLLLQTTGAVPWGLWSVLWRFWPAVLIVIGIHLLWGRRTRWLTPVVTAAVLAGAIVAAAVIQASEAAGGGAAFSQPLQGVARAEVEMAFGAGELRIGSLPESSGNLVEGTASPRVKQEFRVQGGAGELELSVPGRWGFFPFSGDPIRLDANFDPEVPLDLTVKTGASDAELDLTDLKVTRLRVEAGASRVDLRLPAEAGDTEATLKAGAARVTVTVPQRVAARITESTGVGSFKVDTARFPRTGGGYESPGFTTAANRVDLRIESGAARVEVR